MELLSGYPADVFAAVWHDPLTLDDRRGRLSTAERDSIAGRKDVRILAKYARGAKPITRIEQMEHMQLGMGEWHHFGRIAIITDDAMMRHAVQFFAPFFHGPVRVFRNADAQEARQWIEHHDHH